MEAQPTTTINVPEHLDTIRLQLAVHSAMRDRYTHLALISDLLTLALSVILASTVFVGPEIFRSIGVEGPASRVVLGVTSVLLCCWTVLVLRLDWRGRLVAHEGAVRILLSLKSRGRVIAFNGLERTESARLWLVELYTAMEGMPAVNLATFQRLFNAHRQAEAEARVVRRPRTASGSAES